MQVRASRISRSILSAIFPDVDEPASQGYVGRLLGIISAFFSLFHLVLARYRARDFLALRRDVWELDEEEYHQSFRPAADEARRHGKSNDTLLQPIGDLGYSGSTFFTTPNSKYLIKSLPRRFEHHFFTHDLFGPYVQRMQAEPHSLLVRITDMLYTPQPTLGGIVGTAPTRHIIMENLLYGKDGSDEAFRKRWETYDLKPNDYFFPERDIAGGKLATEEVKKKLIDEFPDQVRVTAPQKAELLELLGADTQVLCDRAAVDYSLFLVRFPGPNAEEDARTAEVPFLKGKAGQWRTGVDDADGRWTYRLVVLDFFWSKNKLQPRAMTALVNSFNVFAKRGPMSITAEPREYRRRFLKMVDDMTIVPEG